MSYFQVLILLELSSQIGSNFITEEAAAAALELLKSYPELKIETIDLSVSLAVISCLLLINQEMSSII